MFNAYAYYIHNLSKSICRNSSTGNPLLFCTYYQFFIPLQR